MHALRFGDAVYDVANALRKRFSRAGKSFESLGLKQLRAFGLDER